MHFSHALVAVLSVVGTQAAALPLTKDVAGSSNGLIARSSGPVDGALSALTARGLSVQVATESRDVFARYANMADDQQRSMLIARDLSKRGILDMLVQALSNLITELLGTSPSSQKRGEQTPATALQQLTGMDFSNSKAARQSFAQMLDMLGKALEQQATILQQGANTTSTNSSTTDKSKHSTSGKNSTSTALPDVGSNANLTDTTDAKQINAAKEMVRQGNKSMSSKRSIVDLAERQEGVQGLLEVLRQLVDAILNTLLPMNSRSTSSNATSETDSECPPPGTPNDGMYRPGCPGYGRRAVTDTLLKVRDAAASSDQLAQLLPLLQQLTQQLPQLTDAASAGDVASLGDVSSIASAASAAPTAAATAATGAVDPTAASTPATEAVTSAAASAANGVAGAAATAAQQSLSARDLLDADGFELAKRQQDSLASTIIQLVEMVMQALSSSGSSGNSTDTSSSKKKSSSSADSTNLLASLFSGSMSKRDGIDLSILNNLLGNLLSGAGSVQTSDNANAKRDGIDLSILNNLLGNLLSGAGSSQSSDNANDKRDGLNLSILNNLLGNILSGAGSSQSSNNDKRDGINLSILNNLLGNLLSGDNSVQSSNNAVKRDGIDLSILDNLLGNLLSGDNSSQTAGNNSTDSDGGINISALNNLLGNLLSGLNSSQNARRSFIELTARADFKPVWDEIKKVGNAHFKLERRAKQGGLSKVWSSFRDMVDQGYKEGLERRAPSPKVDTSAFSHATAQYLKDTFFPSASHHDRRSLEQLKPLADAASKFAKQQMQEWTEALNEHSAKHGRKN